MKLGTRERGRELDRDEVATSREAGLRMRISLLYAACLLTTLTIEGGASMAVAIPLTTFRYEAQAQRYCPADIVVWLDFKKEIYYFKKQRRYGRGSTGSFVWQDEARSSGFRRSVLGLR
jgi:hypothetical protein